MPWEVDWELVEGWLLSLDDKSYLEVRAALGVLAEHGPHLGRPLVDTVSRSRHKNMKELRPGSSGRSKIRILFAFDPARRAILLVAGDKGQSWRRWYEIHVPIADDRFDAHLAHLGKERRA